MDCVMTSFREEAQKRGATSDERTRAEIEKRRELESAVTEISNRVAQERDWLGSLRLRVCLDRDWQPNFGVRICRKLDGSEPREDFDDHMECCSIWTDGRSLRYSLIGFVDGDVTYEADHEFDGVNAVEHAWDHLVKSVCDHFGLSERK
jgi:hypothetical protein